MTIEELFEHAQSGSNGHLILDLEELDIVLVEWVLELTGVDVVGFVISIDTYGIRHAIDRHGNLSTEEKRGQIALEDFHIARFMDIVRQADTVRYDFRGKKEQANLRETLVFQKVSGHRFFVALEIRRVTKRGKKCRLVFQTMYIKKSAAP